jgi:23S rRNA (adenine-N6)-dimethyltransferase
MRTERDARRRALSQNFLVDDRAIAAVVGTLHPPPGGTVLDLGAGRGALTARAATDGRHVIAIERDPAWVHHLRAHAPRWGRVEVASGDILTTPFPPAPYYVLSNAPFNIGTRLVRRLLTEAHGLVRAVVVLQRETAHRLAGSPRAGRFAATWAPWFELRVDERIPRAAFRPVPGVDAAVLTLQPRARPLLSPAVYREYDAFLGTMFAGRDRGVGDRLARTIGRSRARAAVVAAGIDPRTVPSDVEPETYAALFGKLSPAREGATGPRRGHRPPRR